MVVLIYKVLIADDDAGMRTVLKKAISKVNGFDLKGEAEDGETAFCLADSLRPDVIFMDVEMPKLDGIECAKRIMDINPKTMIIFATAHQEYMPDAFEVYAFDYIVKPFKIERIHNTLNRIKDLTGKENKPQSDRTFSITKALDKLVIRNKEGISFIDMNDIILIQREDRSTAIYTHDERHITSEGLTELEERLDRAVFIRSHKSYIINLSMIQKIYPYGRWTYIVKLKNTEKDALLTHENYENLQRLFF
mgnify:CR=1 FL=1